MIVEDNVRTLPLPSCPKAGSGCYRVIYIKTAFPVGVDGEECLEQAIADLQGQGVAEIFGESVVDFSPGINHMRSMDEFK